MLHAHAPVRGAAECDHSRTAAPLLTVVIPAYNAEPYLSRALEPLRDVPGVDVVVVDDGSTDSTGAIADDFAREHPDSIHVIHQANGGHGGAINAGVAAARGTYIKILDADDWLDRDALVVLLNALADPDLDGPLDAVFTNFVHERVGKRPRPARFTSVFPQGRPFQWQDVEQFRRRQVLMMHAIVYRTALLRECRLVLPEHTFYVDSLFVVVPLAHARRLYYLPVDLYRYYIGRADQSVDAAIMVRRVDQQLRVNRLALRALPARDAVVRGEVPGELYDTLVHYVEALCAVTSATLARGGTDDHLRERARFWAELQQESPDLYAHMRGSMMVASANLPGRVGRALTSVAYQLARRVIGFS